MHINKLERGFKMEITNMFNLYPSDEVYFNHCLFSIKSCDCDEIYGYDFRWFFSLFK